MTFFSIAIIGWLFIGALVAVLRILQLRAMKRDRETHQGSSYSSFLPLLVLGAVAWPKILHTFYVDYTNSHSPGRREAIAQIGLACGWLDQAHDCMRDGKADEADAYLLLYAGASGNAKSHLRAIMGHKPPPITGPAAYFPREPGQNDTYYWYDLCHRSIGIVDEAATWAIDKRNYYQAYLRLLCADAAVEQMLAVPGIGPCPYCRQGE